MALLADVVAWLGTPDATDWIVAGFTVVLAILAYRQWKTSDRQREIMDEQTKLTKEQFFASHRPRLACRKVYYANPDGVDGTPFEVELADVGYGGARIDAFAIAYVAVHNDGDAQTWRLKEALDAATEQRGLTVPRNGSQVIRTVISAPETVFSFELAEEIIAVGYVVYGNANSDQRFRLGFIRQATRNDRVFRPTDRPEFEYAD